MVLRGCARVAYLEAPPRTSFWSTAGGEYRVVAEGFHGAEIL